MAQEGLTVKSSSARCTHKSSHHPLLPTKDESEGVQVPVRAVRQNATQGGDSPGHLLGWMLSMQAGLVLGHGMAAQTSRASVWLLWDLPGSHSVTHVITATSLGG